MMLARAVRHTPKDFFTFLPHRASDGTYAIVDKLDAVPEFERERQALDHILASTQDMDRGFTDVVQLQHAMGLPDVHEERVLLRHSPRNLPTPAHMMCTRRVGEAKVVEMALFSDCEFKGVVKRGGDCCRKLEGSTRECE